MRCDRHPTILTLQEHSEIRVLGRLPFLLPLLFRLIVQDNVGLVVDLLLDNLLDDVLEGEEANSLVVWVPVPLGICLLDEGHVPLVPGLELVKHVRQYSVLNS